MRETKNFNGSNESSIDVNFVIAKTNAMRKHFYTKKPDFRVEITYEILISKNNYSYVGRKFFPKIFFRPK